MKTLLFALLVLLAASPALAGGGKFRICDPPFAVPCLIPDWPAYDSSFSELPIILPGISGLKDVEARWMVRTIIWHPDGTTSVCRSTGYRDRRYSPPKFKAERTDCGPE